MKLSIALAICVYRFSEGLAPMLANAAGGLLAPAIHAALVEISKHYKAFVPGNFAAGYGLIAAWIVYFHISV